MRRYTICHGRDVLTRIARARLEIRRGGTSTKYNVPCGRHPVDPLVVVVLESWIYVDYWPCFLKPFTYVPL